MKIATAYVEIRADRANFDKDLDGLGDKFSKVGASASKFLTLPIAAGFLAATNAASDLAEATNVTGLIFDQSRPKIEAFVKTTAEGLGQSERAAREATATFGGLLENLGLTESASADWSITLTTLASDLGSAFNKDPAVAVEAIGSAIRGETEPIRQFNVQLDAASVAAKAVELGLADSTTEVSNSARAQATLALIMQQTSAVQGDFANTADGLANQQRVLKARLEDTAASLGESLLPIALDVAGVAEDLISGFAGLPDPLQKSALAALGLVAAVGPISSAAGAAVKAVNALSTATAFLATTQSAAAISAVGVGAALLGAVTVYTAYNALVSAAEQDQRTWNAAAVETVNNQALVASGVEMSTKAIQENAVEAFINASALTQHASSSEIAAESIRSLTPEVELATGKLNSMSEASGVSQERIVQLANELGVSLADSSVEAQNKLAGAIAQISGAVTPTERLDNVTETLGNDFATTSEQVDAFNEALDALLGVQLDAEQAQIRLRQKTDDLAAAVRDGAAADETAQQFRDRLALSTIDVVEAAEAEVEALVRTGIVSTDAAAQQSVLRDRLTELRDRFPGLRDQLQGYIDRLNAIPDTKVTTIVTRYRDEFTGVGGGGGIPLRAKGGPVEKGMPYIVGEERPELFVPNQNGTILPTVPGGASGSSVLLTWNQNAPVYGVDDLEAAITGAIRSARQELADDVRWAERTGAPVYSAIAGRQL